jgi:hypothetical protein
LYFSNVYTNLYEFWKLILFSRIFSKNRNKKRKWISLVLGRFQPTGYGFGDWWSAVLARTKGCSGPRQLAQPTTHNGSPRRWPQCGEVHTSSTSVVGTTVGQHFDGWGSTEGGSDDRAIEAYRSGLWWLATMRLWSYSWGRERGR